MDRKAVVLERLDVAAVVADLFTRCDRGGVNNFLVCCPVHDDKHASCSVDKSKGLWNCKTCGASGNIFDLYMAARGVDFATALHDLEARAGIAPPLSAGSAKRRPASPAPVKPSPAKPATDAKPKPKKQVKKKTPYRYHDANNNFCFQKIRTDFTDGTKTFNFEHPENGALVSGLGENTPLLYGLHRLATSPPGAVVFVVEGEKCADVLIDWGLIAVSSPYGAGTKWPESFLEFFTGKNVVILPDFDEVGEKYAAGVATALLPVAASVKILQLPNLPPKGDICDFVDSQRKGAADA